MAGLATLERWMTGPHFKMAAIAGTIIPSRMIGHECAHWVARAAAAYGMTFLARAFDIAFALLIDDMMAGSAFHSLVRIMVENNRQARACAVIKEYGLVHCLQACRMGGTCKQKNGYGKQEFHISPCSKHIPERWLHRRQIFPGSDKIKMHQA